MNEAISHARAVIEERATQHPGSPFYAFARKEMARVDAVLATTQKPDRTFYESLTHGIGLMCAKELEASDPAFCDAVYGMMEVVRQKAG